MGLFKIIRKNNLSREEEIAILHHKDGISIYTLTTDLLYDGEWCEEHGIDYAHGTEGEVEKAREFVMNAIKKYRNKITNS